MKVAEDLSGKKFGKLTAISMAEPSYTKSGVKKTTWLCKCSCGRERIVPASYLKRGSVTSCGKCTPYARREAKMRECRYCKYSKWNEKLGDWDCIKGKDPTTATPQCKGFWCDMYDKVSGVKNRESKCFICGSPIYSHGRATPLYCEKHRAHADIDNKIIKEAPYELMFELMAGIFARARDDYLYNADNQRSRAESFLKSEWAQELSVEGFDADTLLEQLDEEMLDAISRTDEVNE